MIRFLTDRITLVWIVLVGATILSWELGHGFALTNLDYVRASIIAVAFIKVRYVILDFMEIRHAPRFMRVTAEVWALVVCLALIALYLHPSR
ncbi:MAG: cytochrome C oxidase subunit IV family protein [Panacagrimonas sp.]